MFARVFHTAKRILSRSPSIPARSSEGTETAPTSAPDAPPAMVTTRTGVETPGTATPRSASGKRVGKRELAALDTPTQAKRQKKAAPTPQKKHGDDVAGREAVHVSPEDASDTIAVAVAPTSSNKDASQTSAKKGPLAIRRRSSPQVVVGKLSPPASTATESFEQATEDDAPASPQETVYHTPKLRSGTAHATPVTSKAAAASPAPRAKTPKTSTPASGKKPRGRPRKVQNEDDAHGIEITQTTTKITDHIPSPAHESEPTSKKAHKRFGSEEPADTIVVDTKAPESTHEDEDEDEDADDSDEAPDVVTTATATSKAQAAHAEAERALVAQQQKEAAKRQARKELIAAQQAAKREREEKKAKKLARQQAKQAAKAAPEEEEEEAQHLGLARDGLPALLPDSLLSTLSDQRAPTPPPTRGGKSEEELRREKLNHHIKFLERTEKPIKDVRKGKLSVAVLAQHNRVLPPKMSRDTSNVREHWLKGRGLEKRKGAKQKFKAGKVERRRVGGGGFLRNED
ncbi:hypothetical protein J1614_008467 [Plenodomus biglobosus]|nr:hypothetical protein J1614_008467 [Plenodomus biglobosus]